MQTFIDKLKILQGALILDGYEIDDACVKMVDRFIEAEENQLSNELHVAIQVVVEDFFNVPRGVTKLNIRKRKIVQPRQLVHHFCYYYRVGNLDLIGQLFGNKDHSTVLYSIKTVENLVQTNSKYRKDFYELKDKIENKIRELK